MIAYSKWPNFLLIYFLNNASWVYREDADLELESRQPPPPEPEYDQNGNQIVSEMMGYSNEGEEIWTT